MAKRARTKSQINEWHQSFQQVSTEWHEWLSAHGHLYQSFEEAWQAYQMQVKKDQQNQSKNQD